MICMRTDIFQPFEQYSQDAAKFSDQIRGGRPAAGFDKVLMPGDLERERRQACLDAGRVIITDGVADGLRAAAKCVGETSWD